jgi:circadian clock protein KaiC
MKRVSTGMDSLDKILNGGLPESSTTMITGAPGTGKTILTLNILFNNASEKNKAIYFTTTSEPATKVLRYQQEFSFFNKEKFNTSVLFFDLGAILKSDGLDIALEFIKKNIKKHGPKYVAIDSFKVISDMSKSALAFRTFVHDLSVHLSVYDCTALLVGEYDVGVSVSIPEFAVSDGIIDLSLYSKEAISSRAIRVLKMRGTSFHEGEHAYSISDVGVTIFPRLRPILDDKVISEKPIVKVHTGVSNFDKMLGGGFNSAFSTMIAGSAGTGKTTFSIHFLYEGLKRREPCLLVSMEESPSVIVQIAASYGIGLKKYIDSGLLTIVHRRPVDLNVYELAKEIEDCVTEKHIKRAVFDAISDLQANIVSELALRDYIFSMVGLFEQHGVTSLLTNVIENAFGEFKISEANLSVVVDSIILLRYVEIEAEVSKAISVLKMRGSRQDKALRKYDVTSKGIVIGDTFAGYSNIILGTPLLNQQAAVKSEKAALGEVFEVIDHIGKPKPKNTKKRASNGK